MITLKDVDPNMIANNLTPQHVSAPGYLLADEIAERGITVERFAQLTDIDAESLREIIDGQAPITPAHAMIFEAALGIRANIWWGYRQIMTCRRSAAQVVCRALAFHSQNSGCTVNARLYPLRHPTYKFIPMTISQRVEALGQWLASHAGAEGGAVEAYIVPTADPHNDEYIPCAGSAASGSRDLTARPAWPWSPPVALPHCGPTRAIGCRPPHNSTAHPLH